MRLVMIPMVVLLLALPGCGDSASNADATNTPSEQTTADATPQPSTTRADAAPERPAGDEQSSADAGSVDSTPKPPEERIARPTLTASDLAPPPKTRPVDLLDGAVTVELPDTLMPMTESELDVKYEGGSRPDVAYTDDSSRINFTATLTEEFLRPQQIYEYKGHMEASFRKAFQNMELISNDEIGVDGGPCFLIQFRHTVTDAVVHNLVLGASYENKLLLMTVNFPMQVEQRWIPIARELLLSADFHRSGKDGQPTDEESAAMEAAEDNGDE